MTTKRMIGNWRLHVVSVAVLLGISTAPACANPLILQNIIAIPTTAANVQPGGAFTSFDISYFDPSVNEYFIADRSNASVDIISGSSLTVVGQAQGFTGQGATTSVSGADGVVAVTVAGTTTLYAGDGNSTLKVFNVTNPAAPSLLQTISTGGAFRVDEMAYAPATHQVIAANNADAPAFATIFSTTNGTTPVSIQTTGIKVPGAAAGDGMEQPVWNPNTNSFWVSVPAIAGNAPGGLVQISTTGAILSTIDFGAQGIVSCSPTGLALGASGNLMVGCGNKPTQTILVNPATGNIINTFAAVSGADEVWFDPTSGDFYVTGADASGNRVITLISDATQLVVQSITLPISQLSNAHSVAVDSLNGDIFVPLAGNTATVGGNLVCPLGCIAVFGVPEPPSSPVLLFASTLMLALIWRRRASRG